MSLDIHVPPPSEPLLRDATLRDAFAASALQGMLASDSHVRIAQKYDTSQRPAMLAAMADLAYEWADALVAAKRKRDGP